MITGGVRRPRSAATPIALAAALLISATTLGQAEAQTASSVENAPVEKLGHAPTLTAEDALLTRYEDHLAFEITMDTSDPGTYIYPPEIADERKAPPEVFTGWAFVFNNPEHCVGPESCGADDFSDDVQAGVYGVAGHVTAIDHEGASFIYDRGTDGRMILRGEIAVGDPQWPDLPPEEASTYPLSNPLGAEVHFAIAPHGQVDPATIAQELYSPAGTPLCDCWWVAFFVAEEDG